MDSQETPTSQCPIDFRNRIKDDVSKACSGGIESVVAQRLIADLADKEVTRRAEALTACYNEWERLTKQLPKAKNPDQRAYAADGTVVESFSPDAWKKLNELQGKITYVDIAIIAAVRDAKFDKAFDIAKKAGN